MSERFNRETGLRYARLDGTIVNADPPRTRERVPGWRGAWLWCLKHRDKEAADLIFDRNAVSDECEAGDCGDCHFSRCKCQHHSAVQFRAEHPQLRSLSEAQSEIEEVEYV